MSIKSLFSGIFLLLLSGTIFAQTEKQYSLSALKEMAARSTPSSASRLSLRISKFYLYNKAGTTQNLDSALIFAEAAENYAIGRNSATDISNARLQECNVYNETNQADLSKQLLTKGDAHFKMQLNLELGAHYLFKTGEFKSDLDSADYFCGEAIRISNQLHDKYDRHLAERYHCDILFERGDLINARNGLLKLVLDCQQTGDLLGEAQTYAQMGDHLDNNHSAEKVTYYDEAMLIYRKTANKEAEMSMLKAVGDVHLNSGRLDWAKKELLDVLKWYKENNYQQLQDTYFLLANVARLSGDYSTALYYGLATIDCANKMESDKALGYFYNSLAQIYNDSGDANESVIWYRKTIDALGTQNSELMYNSLRDLSDYLIKQGKSAEVLRLLNGIKPKKNPSGLEMELIASIKGACYNQEGKYELAEQSYLEMFKWEPLAKMHTYNSADSYQTIAEFYMSRNQYAKAEFYLKKVLSMPAGVYSAAKIKDVYLDLYKADSAKNDLASGIVNYKKYKALNDSIFNQTKNWQIQELTIKYNTDQVNRDNTLLRHQSVLEKDKLQKASLLTKITILSIIILLVLFGLVYKTFLNRQRNIKMVAAHQQEIELKNSSLENMIIKQEKLLADKEWLIKEIHHRVKNNLQVVMALLNTQANYLENKEAIRAITDSQNRMYSISLIHQKLFQTEEVTMIDIKPYITELIKFLCDTFHFDKAISFEFNIASVQFDISQAMPLGLIINEAITNIIKYAFPEGRSGIVSILLKKQENNNYLFTISDNGIGLPDGFDLQKSKTLGMVLMQGLSVQLNGEFSIISNEGVTIQLIFELEEEKVFEQNLV